MPHGARSVRETFFSWKRKSADPPHARPFGIPLSVSARLPVPYVFIMCLPAARSFTGPFQPGFFAARCLADVILPPLLFFAILNTSFCVA